jgi:uncharacterized protein (TIGR03083 family)
MTSLASRTIAALRANHDTLAALVPTLSEEQLTGPSGASEWTIAQALSHLGSGAEISRKPVAAAAGIPFDDEDNQTIWARWDGSTPAEQAAGFVEHDAAYLATVEALGAEQLDSLQVDLGFLPAPVPLVVALGMRLNEVANHAWDVRVGVGPSATVDAQSAELLIELFGVSSKPDQVAQEVRLAIPGGGIEIIDAVTVSSQVADPTATFEGPAEAVVRLLSGRLRAPYDAGVSVTGNVTLDDLRRAFPGY